MKRVTRTGVALGQYTLTEIVDQDLYRFPCAFELSRKAGVEYHCDSQSHPDYGALSIFNFVDPDRIDRSSDSPRNLDSGMDGIPVVAREINGDGVPALVVSCDSGGNGIGHDGTIIISLARQGPKEIYFGAPCLFRRQPNGRYEISCRAVYSGGSSPPDAVYLDIPLVWDGHSYTATAESMAKPRLSAAEQTAMAAKLRQETTGKPPRFTAHVMSEIVTLICSGDAQAAHMLLDRLYRGANKIVVEGQVSCLGNGHFSPTELWKAIITDIKQNDFINGKNYGKHTTNYLPLIKKLNPGLFS
jgi:hypothetical protein